VSGYGIPIHQKFFLVPDPQLCMLYYYGTRIHIPGQYSKARTRKHIWQLKCANQLCLKELDFVTLPSETALK
jgi:hypothetical protein